MSVYQNKKRGTYYIKVCVGGRYFYCYKPAEPGSKSFRRKKDAQLYEPVFLSTLTESDADKGILCDDLAQIFLNEQAARLKPNTYYGVERTFRKYVLPCFRGMRVGDVTNAYLDTVNAKLNKRKLNVYQQACCFRLFIRFLKKKNESLDPSRISTPKDHRPADESYQIFTLEQFERLLSVIEDERDRFMVTLLYFYGLRCGEMMGLKWDDFSNGKLHIRRAVSRRGYGQGGQAVTSPKTKNSVRDYPILSAVKPYLESLPRDSEWCFPKGNQSRSDHAVVIGHSEVRRRIDRYVKMAGLPHIKVHGFRHSCVSWLLSNGMSYRTVARWVGDTETVVLQTYSHLLPDEKDEIAEFVDKASKPQE